MKTIKVVCAAIISNDKLFIAQRDSGEFKGMWEFPGGKIEAKETPEQALKREILEELNVEIEVKEKFHRIVYEYPTFILDMDCFIAHSKDHDFSLRDHLDIQWIILSDENIDNINWCPADKFVYKNLLKFFFYSTIVVISVIIEAGILSLNLN